MPASDADRFEQVAQNHIYREAVAAELRAKAEASSNAEGGSQPAAESGAGAGATAGAGAGGPTASGQRPGAERQGVAEDCVVGKLLSKTTMFNPRVLMDNGESTGNALGDWGGDVQVRGLMGCISESG